MCFSAWLWHDENAIKAVELYLKSVEIGGFHRAMARLGYCYDHGSGVKRDMQKAVEYYVAAATKNHPGIFFFFPFFVSLFLFSSACLKQSC